MIDDEQFREGDHDDLKLSREILVRRRPSRSFFVLSCAPSRSSIVESVPTPNLSKRQLYFFVRMRAGG